MFKSRLWIKIPAYAWMFYLPQIFSISMWGALFGNGGLFLMFIASSIGYLIRGVMFLTFPLILLKILLRSHFKMSPEVVEYFKPLAVYGIIAFLMRSANVIFPQFSIIRGILEQGLLLTALIFSYYKLGIIVSSNFQERQSLVKITGFMAGIATCLIFPPPL
ncbi:hypothetical protein PNA2_1451 [Pyrococcus sp. NA2]|uniref:hypothetical protein n=1 Tax=Pyrococcus sp. (strain NA2) TaxID=342949 RepID=UPI000209AF8A|nr:hypothetical protein [Pyrococcus sp. NA2]AEC52366.1 hypothetical protein PNA2_1451 [Pyrococcus sp. NA2]